jgi:hypothetical protein
VLPRSVTVGACSNPPCFSTVITAWIAVSGCPAKAPPGSCPQAETATTPGDDATGSETEAEAAAEANLEAHTEADAEVGALEPLSTPPIQVVDAPAGEQRVSRVVALLGPNAGQVAVLWHERASSNDDWKPAARRFDSAGQPLGVPIDLSAKPPGHQWPSSVVATDDGGFLAALTAGSAPYGLVLARHDASGKQLWEVEWPAAHEDFIVDPSVALQPGGAFVVAYARSKDWVFEQGDVEAALFDPDRAPLGSFPVCQFCSYPEAVAFGSGSFSVAYTILTAEPAMWVASKRYHHTGLLALEEPQSAEPAETLLALAARPDGGRGAHWHTAAGSCAA